MAVVGSMIATILIVIAMILGDVRLHATLETVESVAATEPLTTIRAANLERVEVRMIVVLLSILSVSRSSILA